MTLTRRVSAFFLAALAVVLTTFSTLLYFGARHYLLQQFDQQLHSALQTLTAAVEVESDDVKFDQHDHNVKLAAGEDEIHWTVVNETGRLIASSQNLVLSSPARDLFLVIGKQHLLEPDEPHIRGDWRVLQRRLAAPEPKEESLRTSMEHATLLVTAGMSAAETFAFLRRFAILSAGISVLVWSVAAAVGTWYCRKALAPVSQMANGARSFHGADFARRLPVALTNDELADLGAAFNGLLDQLQEAFERQKRFAADAAHQLRTPLTVLRGQIDVALRRPRSSEEYRDTLNLLGEQASELSRMIEALLFLARSGSNSAMVTADSVELAGWLEQYLGKWNGHARAADLVFECTTRESARLPVTLLGQLIDNLIDNAVKYSPMGSPIRVRLERADGNVVLSVADEGIGIAANEVPMVFEPFFRSSSAHASNKAGTGLGLAIVAQIAQALGGKMECTSSIGAGSRFAFVRPAVTEVQSELMAGAIDPS